MNLAQQIAHRIEEDYCNNPDYVIGDRLPSYSQLSEIYGVSGATLSNALSLLEGRGLVIKHQGKGSFIARSQELPPLDAVGYVITSEKPLEFSLRMYEGAAAAAHESGYELVVAWHDLNYTQERTELQRMVRKGLRGALVSPVPRMRTELERDYLAHDFPDFPIVLLDMAFPEQRRSQVCFDNYHAGLDMTQYLIDRGHRRIAFMKLESLRGELMHRSNLDRYLGYRAALEKADIAFETEWEWSVVETGSSCLTGLLDQWRTRPERETALVAVNDSRALRLIHVAQSLGIDLRREIEMVGFDNLTVTANLSPPLPTTNPDLEKAGRIAFDMLLRELQGELTGPVTHMMPVPLANLQTGRFTPAAS